ncbi:translation initiation factor IF-2 [Dioscorea cayenensis subsp. rotundata]|uniref:Translation initiation factor IF-2 n=1 Tax=Dioscorea cayennensis subsp. rotundata TaxID=55577 RepID=A0AB40D230_DIOCR|nr:translation initiation factor IF-2 [Dioscorea cayenensis subsp. rotundata]
MRGLARFAAGPTSRQSLLSSSHAFSSFSGAGGGGFGRGRGRGSSSPSPPTPSGPGQSRSLSADDDEAVTPPGIGHGRGAVFPSSPVLPSFSSWSSSTPPGAGRGRGSGALPSSPVPDAPDSLSKKPIFFSRDDYVAATEKSQFLDPVDAKLLPRNIGPPTGPGAGRGKPTKFVESGPVPSEENRHLRARVTPRRATETPSQPRLGREEAVRKAMEVLSRGGPAGRGGRGGRGFAGGRGRGGRGGRGRGYDAADELELYVGDNADGEKLAKRLGEANMNKLVEGFEEMSSIVLPSPVEEAYLDALHTNNLIEYEPEYLVSFDTNPDIDEKPPMPIREYLEKMKPFLMAYEGIQSHEEWEEIINEALEKLPVMKELMDMYCGPDRVTAKEQQEELERVAKTLPENIPSSVKRFTDRALLSLQSNPGWGFDKKCQFMDKLVWEVSQQYK